MEDKSDEFMALVCSEGISSSYLSKFIDENFEYPNLKHCNLHQMIWIRDREWFMGQEKHRLIDEKEAAEDYNYNYTSEFHKFYFDKYISPTFCDVEKYKKLKQEDRKWAEQQIEEIIKMIEKEGLENKPWRTKLKPAA